jgi:NTE family protein
VASKIIDTKKIASQIRTGNHEKAVFHINKMDNPFDPVIASASIPLFFGTTYIEDQAYVDGGLVDNNPLDILIEQGCNVILSVPLDHGFNYNAYTNNKLLFINLTDFNVFSALPLMDAYDIIRFTDESIEERRNYGYLVATEIVQKLRETGILKRGLLGLNENFIKVDKFTYIEAPKETYEKVKALRKERRISKKEAQKRLSIKEKIEQALSRGK